MFSTHHSHPHFNLYTSGSYRAGHNNPLSSPQSYKFAYRLLSLVLQPQRSKPKHTESQPRCSKVRGTINKAGGDNQAAVQQSPLRCQNIRMLYTPEYDKQPNTFSFPHKSTSTKVEESCTNNHASHNLLQGDKHHCHSFLIFALLQCVRHTTAHTRHHVTCTCATVWMLRKMVSGTREATSRASSLSFFRTLKEPACFHRFEIGLETWQEVSLWPRRAASVFSVAVISSTLLSTDGNRKRWCGSSIKADRAKTATGVTGSNAAVVDLGTYSQQMGGTGRAALIVQCHKCNASLDTVALAEKCLLAKCPTQQKEEAFSGEKRQPSAKKRKENTRG